ncbi:hypothetical protein [Mycobacterium lepromatosis]|nr:hypothetical protein [Mycobacterium lepromatosis]UKN43016.1 hypothetical protein MLPF_3068 [Mycobacterium lepromatosis]
MVIAWLAPAFIRYRVMKASSRLDGSGLAWTDRCETSRLDPGQALG